MIDVEWLLNGRWIVPVEPEQTVLDHYSIAVNNGTILDILPQREAAERYHGKQCINLNNHALLPGLINSHTHAAMTLLRGLADDLALMDWLNKHIWPAEATWVDESFVAEGTQLAIAEMIKGGVTCFNDMYFFPNIAAQTAAAAGMRACIGMIVLDCATIWAKTANDYIAKGLKVRDAFKHNPLLSFAFAPHAPYTVADTPLQRIADLAQELDVPVHIHVHETAHEVAQSEAQCGNRPLARLAELGLLTPHLLAVHMTQLQDNEIEQLAKHGVQIVHCPESNMKLASGTCPVHKLDGAGVNVALGTDGAASNNALDMFGEMRSAALLAKITAADACAIPAHRALTMATLNGAKALGLEKSIGSLVVGKAADIIAVDLNHVETQPVYAPISQLVYATGRDKVSDVWIGGRQLLRNKVLTTLDEQDLILHAKNWRAKINS